MQVRWSWLVWLAACGHADGGASSPPPTPVDAAIDAAIDAPPDAPQLASIASFTASADTIAFGASATLVAVFDGLATIDHGVGAVTSGVPVAVSPTGNTTYTLTVNGDENSFTIASVSIQVAGCTFDVSSTGFDDHSLMAAVANANQCLDATITFSLPAHATISLVGGVVSTGVTTVVGPGADQLTLSAFEGRLFFVNGGALTIRDLALADGRGNGGNGGDGAGGCAGGGGAGMGGAIFVNAGALTLERVAIANSIAHGGAGGLTARLGPRLGGGGGGFASDGLGADTRIDSHGGTGGFGGPLGGVGGIDGSDGVGDGAGGGGGDLHTSGGAGTFGAGGGGCGGMPLSGHAGFGGGAGGGLLPLPGTFGGQTDGDNGGGGAGLGGAIFVRTGSLTVRDSTFTNNQAIGGNVVDFPDEMSGRGKGGAIFSLVPAVTLTNVTFAGSVAVDAAGTATDNVDLYIAP